MKVFNDQRNKRLQVLCSIYESTGANTEKEIYLRDIIKNTALSESEVVSIATHLLQEKGFIACDSLLGLDPDSGPVWITTKGIIEVKSNLQEFRKELLVLYRKLGHYS